MLNEPSMAQSGDKLLAAPEPARPERSSGFDRLEEAVREVMDVQRADYDPAPPAAVAFVGRLRGSDPQSADGSQSEAAFAHVDAQFAAQDYHAVLTTNDQGQHVFLALKGRVRPRARPWWPNAVLLVLTVLSLLSVGAAQDAALREAESLPLSDLWRGWPYALSVILILGAHELGHYFAARHHGVAVTLPYFIPLPFGFFGTLGAFIQLREPMRNRKVLFDVGAAGPLAGLALAVPILMIGLATSDLEPLPDETYILEGNSFIYAAAKLVVFGELLPNGEEDVFINQLAKAGWTGLFVTGLNLIPLGQLDGGHVALTLLGRRARRLYTPLIAGFVALSLINSMWLLWTLLLFFLGRVYAVPLDSVTPLDPRRRWLGYLALAVFVLVFVPNPLQIVEP
jgi:Zn-dependent protease